MLWAFLGAKLGGTVDQTVYLFFSQYPLHQKRLQPPDAMRDEKIFSKITSALLLFKSFFVFSLYSDIVERRLLKNRADIAIFAIKRKTFRPLDKSWKIHKI